MRFTHHAILWTLPALLVLTSKGSACLAGFTFLGPTPYLSAADSPFAEYLDGPNFYLEDFEDGELNTPGIFQRGVPLSDGLGMPIISWPGVVVPPGEFTDSVDADDGAIDGNGNAGYSLRSDGHLASGTFPVTNTLLLDLGFDEDALGYLPNAFGFVWTDGLPEMITSGEFVLEVRVTDSTGNLIFNSESNDFVLPGDMFRNGTTQEDVFLGVVSTTEIKAIRLTATFLGDTGFAGGSQGFEFFEIDHVQYGLMQIPEPSSILLALGAAITLSILRVRGKCRK